MTERYAPGDGEEVGNRPSGRGSVTERLAGRGHGAREIDLTDEALGRDAGDDTLASPEARPEPDQAGRESSGAFEPTAPAAAAAGPPAEATRPGSSSIFDVDERARQEELNRTGYEPPVADPDTASDGPRGQTTVTEPGDTRDDPDAPQPAGVPGPLLGSVDSADIRNRFLDIQAGFVDEPRQAVEEAGRFVDDLLEQVAGALRQQRGQLAGATAEGSTEDLRLALRAYRQFVDRLLGLAN
jgi:hypothetical protein